MLVELRIGPGKSKIKRLIHQIRRVNGLSTKREVPHLTLYGDFQLPSGQFGNLEKVISNLGEKQSPFSFLIDGFDHRINEGTVIAFKIIPSEELKNFRKELAIGLQKIAPSNKPWDDPHKPFWFHITIANHLSNKFDRVWNYLTKKQEPSLLNKFLAFFSGKHLRTKDLSNFYFPMNGLRVTVLNNNRTIAFEYDLLQKRVLTRSEALSKYVWSKTLREFRIKAGLELLAPEHTCGKEVYLLGDLHLDHQNIIGYCARPFIGVNEMNDVLIKNWNFVVKKQDKVYYLGDLVYGKSACDPQTFCNKLNGEITVIKGNHDLKLPGTRDYEILQYAGYEFLLTHDPDNLPIDWKGWVIHGHKHNNNIRDYPFINGETKRINVSAEVVNYKPVSLDYIISLDLLKIKRINTISESFQC